MDGVLDVVTAWAVVVLLLAVAPAGVLAHLRREDPPMLLQRSTPIRPHLPTHRHRPRLHLPTHGAPQSLQMHPAHGTRRTQTSKSATSAAFVPRFCALFFCTSRDEGQVQGLFTSFMCPPRFRRCCCCTFFATQPTSHPPLPPFLLCVLFALRANHCSPPPPPPLFPCAAHPHLLLPPQS